MGEQAEYLESQGDHGAERDYQEWRLGLRDQAVEGKRARYGSANTAETGATIACPNCSRLIVKRTYNRRFCGTKCRDNYWNTVDPTRAARARSFACR